MITEFTCGDFRALWPCSSMKWGLKIGTEIENKILAYIEEDGKLLTPLESFPQLSQEQLIEIAVLMNNIKRQYKQLQTN